MNNAIPVEKGISDIVGCLTDPIIVFPGEWGDTLPDWLKTAVTLERMMENMKALLPDRQTHIMYYGCEP